MPSGRTHDRITLWSLPPIAGLAYLSTRQGGLTLLTASGFLFSGLMFGPDLDIYSVQYKRWGILRWLWRPYQSLLGHRSLFSHGFLIGTLFRLFYLICILLLIAIPGIVIAQLFWGFAGNWQQFILKNLHLLAQQYWTEAIALFLGLELGAMSHSLSDWLGSAYKRRQKNRTKKLKSRRKTLKRTK